MLRVKVYKDGKALHTLDVRGDDLIIGREGGVDIPLHSAAVSRRHARLQRTADGWQVADMGAANGVYVSRGGGEPQRVVIQPVQPGDVIIIETFSIRFDEIEGGDGSGPSDLTFDEENSLETKRTQFISMVEVLDAGDGKRVLPASLEGMPANSGPVAKPDFAGGVWWARMQSSSGHDRSFELAGKSAVVGTGPDCAVQLPSGPAQLLALDREGPQVSLARLSKWPFPRVSVDGQSVKDAVLSDGDTFEVGDIQVTIHLNEPPK